MPDDLFDAAGAAPHSRSLTESVPKVAAADARRCCSALIARRPAVGVDEGTPKEDPLFARALLGESSSDVLFAAAPVPGPWVDPFKSAKLSCESQSDWQQARVEGPSIRDVPVAYDVQFQGYHLRRWRQWQQSFEDDAATKPQHII